MSEREEWRPVVGYEGFYEVSSLGRVRALRTVNRQSRPLASPRLIGPHLTHGYLRVSLTVDGTSEPRFIHRLVLEAFVGPAPDKHEAAHCNGVSTDNRLTNLRWATKSSNHRDKTEHGTWQGGERNPFAKLTDEQVTEIRKLRHEGWALPQLAQRFGVSTTCVSDASRGRGWTHIEAPVFQVKRQKRAPIVEAVLAEEP